MGFNCHCKKKKAARGNVSPFGALTTALASTFGTGNIIGVGRPIALGGPGAVFWCWLTGVFGMATTYGEALLAVKFRVSTADGKMQGGVMYVLDRGLHMRWLAILFAIFGCAASFGIGCAVQVNAIAAVCKESFNMPSEIVGIVAAGLAALVIFGGIRSIAGVCERLVPFMSLFYIGGCGVILIHNYDFILPALRTIVTMAFSPGGRSGRPYRRRNCHGHALWHCRGLFSNEAGMGSAPIAAAAAKTSSPVRQALVSSTATFWDTVVVCAITGLVLVSSIMKNPSIDMAVAGDGGLLTTMAFAQIPIVGPGILVIGIITFAFSTILGWAYYGECCIRYLTGRHGLIFYRVLYILTAAAAPVIQLNLVWMTADVLNALMVLPNLVSLLCMSDVIVRETRKYLE